MMPLAASACLYWERLAPDFPNHEQSPMRGKPALVSNLIA